MATLKDQFLRKIAVESARILAIVVTPGLLGSIYRAFYEDGAFGIVSLQLALYALLISVCFERTPFTGRTRMQALALIALAVGVGALFRNQSVFAGLAFGWLAGIYLSTVLPRSLRFIVPVLLSFAISLGAWLLEWEQLSSALSFAFTFGGFQVGAIRVFDGIQALSERRRIEAEQALSDLQSEFKRRDLVSTVADIAFSEYHYDSQLLYGDATLNKRMGLAPDHQTISLEKFSERVHPDDLSKVASIVIDGASQPEGWHCVLRHRFRQDDGQWHHMRVMGENVLRDGRMVWIGASVDMTEEVESSTTAQDLTDRIELISGAGGVGLVEFFPDTRTFVCNAEISSRLGLEPSSSEQPIELFWAHQTPETRAGFQLPSSSESVGKAASFTHAFYHANGELRHYRVARVGRELNGRWSHLGFSIDITDEVNAQKRVTDQMMQLSKEQSQKEQMYAVIAHELRTPAASLKMLIEAAEGNKDEVDVELLLSTADQLLGVVDTLGVVAQPDRLVESSKTGVLVTDLVTAQVAMLKPQARKSGMELSIELAGCKPKRVNLHPQPIKQLLSNLVKNALVHSGGTAVVVSAKCRDEGAKQITEICVQDNGRGIPDAQTARLFNPYERGDSSGEGSGLGLFVCREIALSLGGDLVYEDAPDGGARFRFTLSAETDSDAPAQQPESDADKSVWEGLHVLIAEDNLTIRLLTQNILEKKGAQVTAAEDGAKALALCEQHSFDLILSDIFMPNMDGYEFVAGARKLGFKHPIVGLTAATIGEETDKMLASGADLVLSKPVNLEALTEFVSSADFSN